MIQWTLWLFDWRSICFTPTYPKNVAMHLKRRTQEFKESRESEKDPYFPKVLPTIGCVDLSSPAHRRNYPRQNLLKKGWKFRNSCSVACTSPPRSLWELIRLGSGPDPGTLRNPNYLKTDKIEPDHWEWPKNSFDQLRIAWELNRI